VVPEGSGGRTPDEKCGRPFQHQFSVRAGKKLETKYQQKPKKQQALRPLTGNSGEIDFLCKLGGGEERNAR
jgi:hypothetical protein